MRTVIVTNGNMPSLLGLGEFLARNHLEIPAVFVTTKLPSRASNIEGVYSMWRESGSRYTFFKLLINVFLPRLFELQGIPASLPTFLRRINAVTDIIHADNINREDLVDRVRSYAPEILLSYGATSRFNAPLIDTPSVAAINFHYALLPQYAGLSPYYWYLHNREVECGVTLHRINAQLDAGPVVEQRRFPLENHRSVLSVLMQQASMASPILNRLYAGEIRLDSELPQDLTQRSYYRHPSRQEVREFVRGGGRFIERRDVDHCRNALRALRDLSTSSTREPGGRGADQQG